MLLNGLQTVMSTAAAAGSQPDFSERQIRVIHHHDQLPQRQLIKLQQAPTASPLRFMNVCGSHSTTRRPSTSAFAMRDWNFFPALPIRPPAPRQQLDQHEPGVVARLRVFRARIAQAHDEMPIFHAREGRNAARNAESRSKLLLLLGRSRGFLVARRGGFVARLGIRFRRRGLVAGLAGAPSVPSSFFSLVISTSPAAGAAPSAVRSFFDFGLRHGDGDDGHLFVAQNLDALGRFDFAEVNGLAHFEVRSRPP